MTRLGCHGDEDSLQALQENALTWLLWRLGVMVAMTTISVAMKICQGCYGDML